MILEQINGTVRRAWQKVELSDRGVEVLQPAMRSLLCAVEGSIQPPHAIGVSWVLEVADLLDVYIHRHLSIEESRNYIKLPHNPVQSGYDSQKNT